MAAVSTIGDACQVGDGAHASIKRRDKGIPYLMARNLKDGRLDLSKVAYISDEDFEKHFKKGKRAVTRVEADDVVFGIIGSIGSAYVVKPNDKFGLSSSIAILRPETDRVNPKYLYYWLIGPTLQDALYGIKGGVAQSYVSLEMIRSLPLALPGIEIQRKLASILSAYDDLIENTLHRIKILEEMAQNLYREWFVNFRFPGYENVRMVDSELGTLPEGWELVSIGRLLSKSIGGGWGKAEEDSSHHCKARVIRGTDFKDLRVGEFSRTPERFLKPSEIKSRQLQANDLIVENSVNASSRCVGTPFVLQSGILKKLKDTVICASFCKMFRPTRAEYSYVISLHMRHLLAEGRMAFYQNVAANGIGNFQAKRFLENEHLPLPSDEDQRLQLIRPLISLMPSVYCEQLSVLREQRDILLRKLISGELDVSDLAIEVPEEAE